ncbi:unnamed protein product [Prunus armeniaca]
MLNLEISPNGCNGSSGRWNNVGKGSRQNGSVTSGKGLALRAGHGGPSPELVGCRWTARAAPAARAGLRVPAGGRTGSVPSGTFPGRRTAASELVRTRGIRLGRDVRGNAN